MQQSDQPSKTDGSGTKRESERLNNLTTFLIADLEHFGQGLLQNEQMGEGRFRFFLTLITAIIAGLVTLHTAKNDIVNKDALPVVVNFALIVLFLFGVLTYLRMLHRDLVSEGYKQDLKYIRVRLGEELDLYDYPVPFRPDTDNDKWGKRLRAGYTQTVGAVCSLLFSILVLYDLHLIWKQGWLIGVSPMLVILAVLIIFVVLCYFASHYAVKNKEKAKKCASDNRVEAEARAKDARKAAD